MFDKYKFESGNGIKRIVIVHVVIDAEATNINVIIFDKYNAKFGISIDVSSMHWQNE